jgi:chromosome partitioning protein
MRKLAIALAKGGVSKSTTAVSLSHGLALRKHRVLLVDCDSQGHCSRLLGVNPDVGLAQLIDGNISLLQAVYEARPNLWLLCGGKSLAATKQMIARKDIRAEGVLSEALEEAEGLYDFVILDTAPSWDNLSVNAMFYIDTVLSPVSMELLSVDGLAAFQQHVAEIRKYRELEIQYILPTFYDRRVKKSSQIVEKLKAIYGSKVCVPIRYSVRVSETPGCGKTIFEYAPKDRAAYDYAQLVRRIENGKTS